MEAVDFFVGKRSLEVETIAKQKGFEKIFFVKEIRSLADFSGLKKKDNSYDVGLINTKNLNFLRRFVDKATNYFEYVAVLGVTDLVNRSALENRKVFALVAPEINRGDDFLFQRNSGLNHVLCKIAKERKKLIIFRISDFSGTEEKKASFLGKLMQNLKLCKKYKVDYLLTNFASETNNILHVKQLRLLEKVFSTRFRLKLVEIKKRKAINL